MAAGNGQQKTIWPRLLRGLVTKYGKISEDDLEQMVDEYESSEEVGHMLRFFSEEKEAQILERGREEGLKKGREEGEKQGVILAKQETFIQILEHKFDEFSDVIPEMIRQVDEISELDEWINRVLMAESLSDLWVQPSHEMEIDELSSERDQELETDDLTTFFEGAVPTEDTCSEQNSEQQIDDLERSTEITSLMDDISPEQNQERHPNDFETDSEPIDSEQDSSTNSQSPMTSNQ